MKNRAKARQPLSNKAKLIGLAVGGIAVWQIWTSSLASWHGSEGDLSAADYAGTSQAAAAVAAGQRLNDSDFAGAKIFATKALSISPIDITPLRELGLSEQGLGDNAKSAAIFSQTAALGWRDTPTQLWLAQAFLQQKDYASAAQRIDASLRTNPDSTDLYPVVDHMITDPAFMRALAKRLVLAPAWRIGYLRQVDGVSPDVLDARAKLLALLSGNATPPSRDEVIPTLYALIGAGQAPLALHLWLRSQGIGSKDIYDPTFASAATTDTSPFEWTIRPVSGAALTTDQQGSGRIVTVTTDGSAAGLLMQETVTLSPGSRTLRYTGDIPAAARGALGWTVQCLRTGKALLNTLQQPPASSYRFDVPADCTSQRVSLLVASSAAAAGSKAQFSRLDVN